MRFKKKSTIESNLNFLNHQITISFFDICVLVGIGLIPLIWSKYLNANYVSAKTFLLYFISSVSVFASLKRLSWPKLSKVWLGFLVFIFLEHLVFPVFNYFLFQQKIDFLMTYKFLSFSLLVVYFYNLKLNLDDYLTLLAKPLLILFSFIATVAIWDFINIRILDLNTNSGFLLGSFGNVNMLAEFLVLSLPFLFLWLKKENKIPLLLKNFLFFFWIFFIFYCRSRSAWIGFTFWFLYASYLKKISKSDVLVLVSAFIIYHLAIFPFEGYQTIDPMAVKQESFMQRLNLYKSTVRMIFENPFGVGVGKFISEIIPYLMFTEVKPTEFVYFDQPHSDLLKWSVQFGWLGGLLTILGLTTYLKKIWIKKDFFLISTFIVLMPQLAFQFPFENPASLMYLAFVFAQFLKLFPVADSIQSESFLYFTFKNKYFLKFKAVFVTTIAVVGITYSIRYVGSIYLETSHQNRKDLIQLACDLNPFNLNACYQRDHYLIINNHLIEARLALTDDLANYPFHSSYLRLLPFYFKAKDDLKKSCESILQYNYIFYQQKIFSQETLNNCSEFKVPVGFINPGQFKKDIIAWEKSLLNQ